MVLAAGRRNVDILKVVLSYRPSKQEKLEGKQYFLAIQNDNTEFADIQQPFSLHHEKGVISLFVIHL